MAKIIELTPGNMVPVQNADKRIIKIFIDELYVHRPDARPSSVRAARSELIYNEIIGFKMSKEMGIITAVIKSLQDAICEAFGVRIRTPLSNIHLTSLDANKTLEEVTELIRQAMTNAGYKPQFKKFKAEYMYDNCGAMFFVERNIGFSIEYVCVELAGTAKKPLILISYS